MAISLGGKGKVNAEINVTPMVDVMMVLLVIFMVTTPMMQQGIPVKLPDATQGVKREGTRITITVKADGSTFIDADYIEPGLLVGELQNRLTGISERQVHLKVDRTLEYQKVLDLMEQFRKNSIEILSIIVDVPAVGGGGGA